MSNRSSPERPDVTEGKRLETEYNLETVTFEDARWLLHDFIEDVLINEGILTSLNIPPKTIDMISGYKNNISEFLTGIIDSNSINQKGYEAWISHDNSQEHEKAAIAFTLIGLCDKKKAFFDEYGTSMHFQALLFHTYNLGDEILCTRLIKYINQHPKMQKYKN